MVHGVKFAVVATLLTAFCYSQESFVTVNSKAKEKWPAAEINNVYLSSCAAVQREFGSTNTPVRPKITLVLGATTNSLDFDNGTVFLAKWEPDLFAQGVVMLAFEALMPPERRMAIARRALTLAGAAVDVTQLAKR